MTAIERTETLIQAEGDLTLAVRRMVLAIGTDRAEEVALQLVRETIQSALHRARVMKIIAHEAVLNQS